jgi:hypothetical protein
LAPVNIDSSKTSTDNAKSAKCALYRAASLAVVHVPFWNSVARAPQHFLVPRPKKMAGDGCFWFIIYDH